MIRKLLAAAALAALAGSASAGAAGPGPQALAEVVSWIEARSSMERPAGKPLPAVEVVSSRELNTRAGIGGAEYREKYGRTGEPKGAYIAGENLILLRDDRACAGWVIAHEIGHWFDGDEEDAMAITELWLAEEPIWWSCK